MVVVVEAVKVAAYGFRFALARSTVLLPFGNYVMSRRSVQYKRTVTSIGPLDELARVTCPGR